MTSASGQPSLLTINGGSSSIKLGVFALDETAPRREQGGSIDGIGLPQGTFRMTGSGPAGSFSRSVAVPNQAAAVTLLMRWMEEELVGKRAPAAVGHRIVHGGPRYFEPHLITDALLGDLRGLSHFDPEHLPEELALAAGCLGRFPGIAQVACFDTAFHHDMPRVARLLPIPRRYEAEGLRRYGFHGLSYAYLMQELERVAGPAAARGRVILAHLGSGASLAAVREGQSIDTTMALTPAAGLVMGTRSGDLDPGVLTFLGRNHRLTAFELDHLVNHESGLLGVSESSSDMRVLLARQTDDLRAAEAVELFCYQVKKGIGALAAALGGLDTLVFAGGIGENAAAVRARVCHGLGFLGIVLDDARNAAHAGVISTATGATTVHVVHTDEESMIAQAVFHLLGLGRATQEQEKRR